MKWINGEGYKWDKKEIHEDCPAIVSYFLAEKKSSPVIIVFPGGGYGHRAYHEGEPVAKWLNYHGFHACVARYKVRPIEQQETIQQGLNMVQLVKQKMAEIPELKDQRLGVLGFSAGGHLAAMISNLSTPGLVDFQILCYPVITMGEYTHEGSRTNLLGHVPTDILIDRFSAEKQVHPNTPPAFLWSTVNDASVSVMNSYLYAQALQENRIAYELHLFPDGRHGLGLANDHLTVKQWSDLCITWINQHFTDTTEKRSETND